MTAGEMGGAGGVGRGGVQSKVLTLQQHHFHQLTFGLGSQQQSAARQHRGERERSLWSAPTPPPAGCPRGTASSKHTLAAGRFLFFVFFDFFCIYIKL